MNIGDEIQLRASLGAELDLLDPGPLPLEAVVKQGRAVMIRRRALAAVAVVVVAAAAVTVPRLVHIAHQPPAPPLRYHVTVNPPGKGVRSNLIATGTLDKLRWSAKGTVDREDFNVCWRVHGGRYDSWCDGDTLPAPAFPRVPASFYGSDVLGPAYVTLVARADVSHLLVSLSNGQTVTLRPIRAFGRERAGFAAIVVPSNASITEIQAYSATGEVGYAVPFSTPTDIETVRWLKPGQPALPKPASYTVAAGHVRGNPWVERLDVGPWGFCYRNTWNGVAGSDSCVPISVNQPGGNARSLGSVDFDFRVAFSVIIGPRQLSYVVARTGHGAPFLVRPYRVGAANFVVLATASKLTTRWIAYSAVGARLGSGSFYN